MKDIDNDAIETIFNRVKNFRIKQEFHKTKRIVFISAIICSFFVIVYWIMVSDSYRIKGIHVNGNQVLTSDYVINFSTIKQQKRIFLVIPQLIENKIEKSPFIKKSSVTISRQGIVTITIEEKRVLGYLISDKPTILVEDGTLVDMDDEFLFLIGKVPSVQGFDTDESLQSLIIALNKIEREMIVNISEIIKYPLKYDANNIQCIMQDGNFFFASFYSLESINNYDKISEKITKKGACIYSSDNLQTVYTSECPWNVVNNPVEYWTDNTGAFIRNKYGDLIVKKYYVDSNGTPILDEHGFKIPIPIGE